MRYKANHIGYLTGDIEATIKEFEKLGYVAGDVFKDDTQRTYICFLTKPNELNIELVMPYQDNKTMQKMLAKRGIAPLSPGPITMNRLKHMKKEGTTE